MKEKLRLIYFPSLLLGAAFIAFYTLFYWLLFTRLNLWEPDREVMHFGLPTVLLCVISYFLLWPRIRLLKLNFNSAIFFAFLFLFGITFINIMTVKSLANASGKLLKLNKISEIQKHESSAYYSANKYFVSKKEAGVFLTSEVRGKYNDKLHINIFVTLPFYDSPKSVNPSAWLGFRYHTEISNYLSQSEQDGLLEAFITKSDRDLNDKEVQDFTFLERVPRSSELEDFLTAAHRSPKFNDDNGIILKAFNIPFELRNQGMLATFRWSLGLVIVGWFIMLLFPKIDEERRQNFLNEGKRRFNCEEIAYLLLPRENYVVTPILLYLNGIVFLGMFFWGAGFETMKSSALLLWGANYRPAIEQEEYWRLLTSIFLHGGIIHLVSNLLALFYLGSCLEPILGKFRMLGIFLFSGIGGSIVSYFWSGELSVGASGAILGLSGAGFMVFALADISDKEIKNYLLNMIMIIPVASVLVGFLLPNIDNAGHIGGFITGSLMGIFARRKDLIYL